MEDVASESNKCLVEKDLGKESVNDQPSNAIVGDLQWVLLKSVWWPAQVVDANTVSEVDKPRRKTSSGDVLVRLYGSYIYKYVDIHGSRAKFKNILIENNFNHIHILKKSLEQDLPSLNSVRKRRRRRSKFEGTVLTEASQNGSIENHISDKSQAKVSSKKQKQEKSKTDETHPESPETKIKKRKKEKSKTDETHPESPETKIKKQKKDKSKIDETHPESPETKIKKQKKEKSKTDETHPESPETKIKKRKKEKSKTDETQPKSPETKIKKRKKEKSKTDETHLESTDTKSKNNGLKLYGVHHDSEPSTPNIVNTSPRELSGRRMKVMQSLGLIAPSGSPFPHHRFISSTPTTLN